MGGAGLTIYIQLYNSIFFFVFASVLYAVVRHSMPPTLKNLYSGATSSQLQSTGHPHLVC